MSDFTIGIDRDFVVARLRTEAFLSGVNITRSDGLHEVVNILAVGSSINYFSPKLVEEIFSISKSIERDAPSIVGLSQGRRARVKWPLILESVFESRSLDGSDEKETGLMSHSGFEAYLMDQIVDLTCRMSSQRMVHYRSLLSEDRSSRAKWIQEIERSLLGALEPDVNGSRRSRIRELLSSRNLDSLDDSLNFERNLDYFVSRLSSSPFGRSELWYSQHNLLDPVVRGTDDKSLAVFLSLGSTPMSVVSRLPDRYRKGESGKGSRHTELLGVANAVVRVLSSDLDVAVPSIILNLQLGRRALGLD